MRRYWTFLVLLAGQLFLTTGIATAAEKSLDHIHQAWRNALNGIQTFGLALQTLDSDATSCGLERMTLAKAVESGLKNAPISITPETLQHFNLFIDVSTLHGADERCTSMILMRVSAFVDPSYSALLAAEITPWSERAIVISSKENHRRAVEDELSRQASQFANAWREEQSR